MENKMFKLITKSVTAAILLTAVVSTVSADVEYTPVAGSPYGAYKNIMAQFITEHPTTRQIIFTGGSIDIGGIVETTPNTIGVIQSDYMLYAAATKRPPLKVLKTITGMECAKFASRKHSKIPSDGVTLGVLQSGAKLTATVLGKMAPSIKAARVVRVDVKESTAWFKANPDGVLMWMAPEEDDKLGKFLISRNENNDDFSIFGMQTGIDWKSSTIKKIAGQDYTGPVYTKGKIDVYPSSMIDRTDSTPCVSTFIVAGVNKGNTQAFTDMTDQVMFDNLSD